MALPITVAIVANENLANENLSNNPREFGDNVSMNSKVLGTRRNLIKYQSAK